MKNKPALKKCALAALFIVASCTSLSGGSLENIPLTWKPTTNLAELGAVNLTDLSKAQIRFEMLEDIRKNPSLIAENREKSEPKSVTTKANVAVFVTEHMKKTLEKAGLNIVDDGGTVSITGEIKDFFVTETNTYQGEVALNLRVKNRSGKILWTGITSGSAERFGRSYSAENYYEVLSDSIIEAAHNLLREPGFHKVIEGS